MALPPPAGRPMTLLRSEMKTLRMLHYLHCRTPSVVAVEGELLPSGKAPEYVLFLCEAHRGGLQDWPGEAVDGDTNGMGCGTVLDFRDLDVILQSHVDLWLRDLTGADPADHGGDWAAVLRHACEYLDMLVATEDGAAYYDALTMLELASATIAEETGRSGGAVDRWMLATALAHAESLALAARRGDLRAPVFDDADQ